MTIALRASAVTLGIVGWLILTLLITGLRAEAQTPVTLEGENVVTYDTSGLPTTGTHESYILQGQAITDGCSFNVSGEVDADFRGTILTQETAYDPDTCRSLITKVTIPQSGTNPAILSSTNPSKYAAWRGTWKDPSWALDWT